MKWIGGAESARLARAAGVRSGDLVVATAGDGDLLLECLGSAPRLVLAVDPRPASVNLAELKLGAVKSLSHGEYLELLGIRDSGRRRLLYFRVRWLLSSEASDYWDGSLPRIDRGILRRSGTGRGAEADPDFERIKENAHHSILVRERLDRYLPLLPDECVDRFVLAEPFRSFGDRERLWRQLFRTVKPGGRIVLPRNGGPCAVGQGAILEEEGDGIPERYATYVAAKSAALTAAAD